MMRFLLIFAFICVSALSNTILPRERAPNANNQELQIPEDLDMGNRNPFETPVGGMSPPAIERVRPPTPHFLDGSIPEDIRIPEGDDFRIALADDRQIDLADNLAVLPPRRRFHQDNPVAGFGGPVAERNNLFLPIVPELEGGGFRLAPRLRRNNHLGNPQYDTGIQQQAPNMRGNLNSLSIQDLERLQIPDMPEGNQERVFRLSQRVHPDAQRVNQDLSRGFGRLDIRNQAPSMNNVQDGQQRISMDLEPGRSRHNNQLNLERHTSFGNRIRNFFHGGPIDHYQSPRTPYQSPRTLQTPRTPRTPTFSLK